MRKFILRTKQLKYWLRYWKLKFLNHNSMRPLESSKLQKYIFSCSINYKSYKTYNFVTYHIQRLCWTCFICVRLAPAIAPCKPVIFITLQICKQSKTVVSSNLVISVLEQVYTKIGKILKQLWRTLYFYNKNRSKVSRKAQFNCRSKWPRTTTILSILAIPYVPFGKQSDSMLVSTVGQNFPVMSSRSYACFHSNAPPLSETICQSFWAVPQHTHRATSYQYLNGICSL